MDFDFSPEQRRVPRRGRAVPRRERRPRRLRPHPGEHGADRRHARSGARSWRKLGEQGWLGITWPKEWGGQEGDGVYEYLLNEALAGRGGPQIGKGVGIIGKTILRHGSEKMKQEFLPKILRNEIEFAVGYSEPDAGSDAASMKLKATRDGDGWRLNGQKTWTTSAHFAEWYWVGARTDPERRSTAASRCSSCRSTSPASRSTAIWTMGDERTNDVFFDDVFVPDDYVVGEVNHGFQYISEALDLERFTMFTFSPIKQRLDLLCDYVATETVDGEPLRDDPVDPQADRAARHRRRGRARARPALRRRVDEGRRAADRRRRRSTSCSRPSSRSGSRTRRWTSAGPARSCGCRPRTRR